MSAARSPGANSNALTVGDLKKALRERGVSLEGVLGTSELVQLARVHGVLKASPAPVPFSFPSF